VSIIPNCGFYTTKSAITFLPNLSRLKYNSTMKVVYMEQTINWLAQIDPHLVNNLIQSGTVKKTESGINYLVIEEDGNTDTKGN
jgi:hypothetical protein